MITTPSGSSFSFGLDLKSLVSNHPTLTPIDMKAPELPTKIYFTILDMGSGYVYTPSLDDNGGTVYIRKDALLEWARIEKNKCVGNSSWQRFNALQDMIDKLNEM